MLLLQVIGIVLAVGAIVAASSLLVVIVGWAAGHTQGFIHRVKSDRVELEGKKKQNELNAIKVLRPDENGRAGVFFDGAIFRNADSSEVFSMEITKSLDPIRYRLDSIQKTLLSMKGISIQPKDVLPELASGEVQGELPDYVSLEDALRKYNVRPSINNVFLGVSKEGPVMADFERCTHVLLSSASGWGKSTAMESMAKQLVLDKGCELCFVDIGVNTFSAFASHSKYGIADTTEAACVLFQHLIDEASRRKEKLRELTRAKNISDYNALSGNNEKTICVFIDEGAFLFSEKETKRPITMLAQMSRKVSIFLIAAGTDWKASTIDSSCTSNFSTRIAMHLMPGLSRSLINCTDAYDLDKPGRALALLPGRKLLEMQCPQVTSWDDLPSSVEQETLAIPIVATLEDRVKEVVAQVDSVSVSAVCRALDMKPAGADFYKIKDLLTELGEL